MEEKCSILESKLFQLENSSDNVNKSKDDSIESGVENQSPTEHQPGKRKFGEHLSFPRKVITLESARHISPSLCVKSSSIAGLSPLLKRTKSADLHKLSPANDDKTETFSILRKPRLIHQQTKKSELRPSKLNKVPTYSNNEGISATNDLSMPSKIHPQSSLSKMMNLDNRFRLGSLSKPTSK